MSNEQYLTVSYVLVALASLWLGLLFYAVLRHPFAELTSHLVSGFLARQLRRLCQAGLLLSGLMGFLSVSYYERGCGGFTYEQIIANRPYLVEKSQEQLAQSFVYLGVAVLAWVFLCTFSWVLARRPLAPSGERSGPDTAERQ